MWKIKVYCHKTHEPSGIINGHWYDLDERNFYYIKQYKYNLYVFYKTIYTKSEKRLFDLLFSDYFYTEQEYNRIKSLNELLNEE